MAGPLGTRGFWQYTSDSGNIYTVRSRDADNVAIGNTPDTRDGHPSRPSSLKPRYVWGLAPDGSRRKFHVGSTSNPAYHTPGSLTVDGITFQITGRVGERDFGTVSE
jgi:hypothetical protein